MINKKRVSVGGEGGREPGKLSLGSTSWCLGVLETADRGADLAKATTVLRNLAKTDSGVAEICDAKGPARLLALLESATRSGRRDVFDKAFGLLPLLNRRGGDRFIDACLGANGSDLLLDLVENPTYRDDVVLLKGVVNLLADILRKSGGRGVSELVKANGLDRLLDIAEGFTRDEDRYVVEGVFELLSHVVKTDSGWQGILDVDGVERLLSYLESGTSSSHTRLAASNVLRQLIGKIKSEVVLDAVINGDGPARLLDVSERFFDGDLAEASLNCLISIVNRGIKGVRATLDVNGVADRLLTILENSAGHSTRDAVSSVLEELLRNDRGYNLILEKGLTRILNLLEDALARGLDTWELVELLGEIALRREGANALLFGDGLPILLGSLGQEGSFDEVVRVVDDVLRVSGFGFGAITSKNEFREALIDDWGLVFLAVSHRISERRTVSYGNPEMSYIDSEFTEGCALNPQTGPMFCAAMEMFNQDRRLPAPVVRYRLSPKRDAALNEFRGVLSYVSELWDGDAKAPAGMAGDPFSGLPLDLEKIVFGYMDVHTAACWLATLVQHRDDPAFLTEFGGIVSVLRRHDRFVRRVRALVGLMKKAEITPADCIANIDRLLPSPEPHGLGGGVLEVEDVSEPSSSDVQSGVAGGGA